VSTCDRLFITSAGYVVPPSERKRTPSLRGLLAIDLGVSELAPFSAK
jgi:hypothetical protein